MRPISSLSLSASFSHLSPSQNALHFRDTPSGQCVYNDKPHIPHPHPVDGIWQSALSLHAPKSQTHNPKPHHHVSSSLRVTPTILDVQQPVRAWRVCVSLSDDTPGPDRLLYITDHHYLTSALLEAFLPYDVSMVHRLVSTCASRFRV